MRSHFVRSAGSHPVRRPVAMSQLSSLRPLSAALPLAMLLGCAGTPDTAKVTPPSAPPRPVILPVSKPVLPVTPPPSGPLVVKPAPPVAPLPTPPVAPRYPSEAEGRAMVMKLLPAHAPDAPGWAADIFGAFAALKLPATKENFCAAIAVIEQESSFQADPVVPGLNRIVWQEIEKRRERYHIPQLVLAAALLKSSPDGRSYKARIDALRTEKQMNLLYNQMMNELPFGQDQMARRNPIKTGGPMQVSVEFAENQIKEKPYPYPRRGSIRDEVFERRGGVYFGVAILLDYPAPYTKPIYRFADFNAGRYSSRNAALQAAVARLTGQKLALDGDMLRYEKGGAISDTESSSQRALYALAGRLGLSQAEVLGDLKWEKSAAFEHTPVFVRTFALADKTLGKQPREILPGIELKSPKITRKLTTAWFADRVNGRYETCLVRAGKG